MSTPHTPRSRTRRFMHLVGIAVVAAVVFWAIAALTSQTQLIYNYTDSLPRGFYIAHTLEPHTTQLDTDQLVLVRDESGVCPKALGPSPLLKRVIARSGQVVCLDARTGDISVDGQYQSTSALTSSTGRALSFALEGCRTLGPEQLWVHTDHPRSCDSRVLGAVEVERHIIATVTPLWTPESMQWEP